MFSPTSKHKFTRCGRTWCAECTRWSWSWAPGTGGGEARTKMTDGARNRNIAKTHITLGFQGHLGFGTVWLDHSKKTYQSNIKPQEVGLENICHSQNGWAHRYFRVRLKRSQRGPSLQSLMNSKQYQNDWQLLGINQIQKKVNVIKSVGRERQQQRQRHHCHRPNHQQH